MPDPYSRSYWRFADEYPDLYADDHTYALWSRLRDIADMAWPASATLPMGTQRKALGRLVEAELVILQPGGHYRIRGMDKHRQARSESARNAAAYRWGANGNAGRNANGNADAMPIPSRAKKAEPSRPPAMPDEEQREHLERLKATISGVVPLPKPVERLPSETDDALVARYRAILSDDEEPSWKRDAAKAQLELLGVQP
jgi:hypothetical protein